MAKDLTPNQLATLRLVGRILDLRRIITDAEVELAECYKQLAELGEDRGKAIMAKIK